MSPATVHQGITFRMVPRRLVILGQVVAARFVFAFASAGLFLACNAAPAAPIVWGPAATINADTNVLTTGSSVFAYSWANSTQTVNGQTFSAPAAGVTLTDLATVNTTAFTSTTSPFHNLSTAYKSILVGAAYGGSGVTGTVTLNNLSAGRSYALQHWVSDPRTGPFRRTATLGSIGGNSVSLAYPMSTNWGGWPIRGRRLRRRNDDAGIFDHARSADHAGAGQRDPASRRDEYRRLGGNCR